MFFQVNDTQIDVNGTEIYKPTNPLLPPNIGNFQKFYVVIALCSLLLGFLLILNIICCCSKYSHYWVDRHTGNRWIVSIWSTTPHKQPPLDVTELDHTIPVQVVKYPIQEVSRLESQTPLTLSTEYIEPHKRESDI